MLTEAVAMLASYLSAERELGRLAADADVETLAATLTGTGHLLFAGRAGDPPPPDDVHEAVRKVIAAVVRWDYAGRSRAGA